MELSKKTTILFSPALHAHLLEVARQTGTSLGHLVRKACEVQYGYASAEDRIKAVEELDRMSLPVANPQTMKRESVAEPEDLGS